ncbi:MAG: hypothetical protein AAB482_02900, partial [Patescibacteria group bacterium]
RTEGELIAATSTPQPLKKTTDVANIPITQPPKDWKTSQITQNGTALEFSYPPNWFVSKQGDAAFLDNPSYSEPCDNIAEDSMCGAEDPPEITLRISQNSDKQLLGEFVVAYNNGWYSYYKESTQILVNNHRAILVSDLHGTIQVSPILAAFIETTKAVVIVTAHSVNSVDDYYKVLGSLQLSE